MTKNENIKEFYKRNKLEFIPIEQKNDIGHFNIFKRDSTRKKPITFNRREYYKITLLKGKIKIDYADKSIISDKYALMFSDPLVPYSWEPLDVEQDGYFCIFTETFFHKFGLLKSYPVFQANGDKVFILNKLNVQDIEKIYKKMFEEINSDYTYKYDVLKNLVFELIHYAMKTKPALVCAQEKDRTNKIATLFMELVERQFPIKSPYQPLELKNPSDFAINLNIHTNHLNKVIKTTTGKTTSEFIAQRVLQEAKILLKHTTWSISDISFALGFEEPSHFTNFFKKRIKLTPKQFKNQ